jgi:GNAT superfamily N-acetyltransferase
MRTRARRFVQRMAWDFRPRNGRDELVARHLDGLRHWNRIVCESQPGARLLELDGIVAGAIPAVAEHPDLNVVVYEHANALADGLDELAAAYLQTGVRAWMVCVPPADSTARRVLKRAGYRLPDTPFGMGCRPTGVERPLPSALEDWTADGDPAVMAEIADRAFDHGTAFRRAYSSVATQRARIYLASSNGRPAACVVTADFEGNCAVNMVATLPEARGRGLSTGLLRHALADAADRGCELSTLTASDMARRVYERLGYTGLGHFEHWEMHWPR